MFKVLGAFDPVVAAAAASPAAAANSEKFARLMAANPEVLDKLQRIAWAMGLRGETHDDAVQHAVEEGLKSIHRFEEGRTETNFADWMATIQRRSVYGTFRQFMRSREVPTTNDTFTVIEEVAARKGAHIEEAESAFEVAPLPEHLRQLVPHVGDALDALPDRLGEVARLCLLEGKGEAEVAQMLGMSGWEEVHSLVMRARSMLRRKLESAAAPPPEVHHVPKPGGAQVPPNLTPRLQEIWELQQQGLGAVEIGEQLGLTPDSVRACFGQINRANTVSPREQELWNLAEVEGLNKDEIAERTGLKPGSVVTILVRARKKLG